MPHVLLLSKTMEITKFKLDLFNVPGVAVNKGGFFDTVLMRGKEPSILINGRDMNPFITNTSMITGSMNVGMGAVERIEVIKGPQAAIHGPKAVSGAVNVIHKRGDKDNPFAELRGFYGTGDELSGGLSLGGGHDNLSWFLDFSAAQQDEYKTPKGKIPYVDYKRKNLYARLDYAQGNKMGISRRWIVFLGGIA